MRGIVRARVYATGLIVLMAQVTGGCLTHNTRFLGGIGIRGTLDDELMHVDVAVRATLGAGATANAPVLDDDL